MAAPHGEHAHEHHLDINIVSLMLILLIAFTLTSEKLLHALHRWLGHGASVGQEIFHKVKDELMLVGVLTLLLDVAERENREERRDGSTGREGKEPTWRDEKSGETTI